MQMNAIEQYLLCRGTLCFRQDIERNEIRFGIFAVF